MKKKTQSHFFVSFLLIIAFLFPSGVKVFHLRNTGSRFYHLFSVSLLIGRPWSLEEHSGLLIQM